MMTIEQVTNELKKQFGDDLGAPLSPFNDFLDTLKKIEGSKRDATAIHSTMLSMCKCLPDVSSPKIKFGRGLVDMCGYASTSGYVKDDRDCAAVALSHACVTFQGDDFSNPNVNPVIGMLENAIYEFIAKPYMEDWVKIFENSVKKPNDNNGCSLGTLSEAIYNLDETYWTDVFSGLNEYPEGDDNAWTLSNEPQVSFVKTKLIPFLKSGISNEVQNVVKSLPSKIKTNYKPGDAAKFTAIDPESFPKS